MKTMTGYIIRCSTGCTCCSDKNHYRGVYKTREDAERRVKYFLDPNSVNNPVSSQYASKGRYDIKEEEIEVLPDGRWILRDKVLYDMTLVEVNENGCATEDWLNLECF